LQVACHGAAHDAYSDESNFAHSDLFSVFYSRSFGQGDC
jgi:hypothetical protein